MDVSFDYFTNEKLIIFWEGENPEEQVPDGWEIIVRDEPSEYKGFINPGMLICKKKENKNEI